MGRFYFAARRRFLFLISGAVLAGTALRVEVARAAPPGPPPGLPPWLPFGPPSPGPTPAPVLHPPASGRLKAVQAFAIRDSGRNPFLRPVGPAFSKPEELFRPVPPARSGPGL